MTENEINRKVEDENRLYRTYLESLVKEGIDKIKDIAVNIKQENSDRFSELKEEMILFKTEILILKSKMWNRLNFYIMYGLIGLSFIFSLYVLISNRNIQNQKDALWESIEKIIPAIEETREYIKENKEFMQDSRDMIQSNKEDIEELRIKN
jgi:hypothetical protein